MTATLRPVAFIAFIAFLAFTPSAFAQQTPLSGEPYAYERSVVESVVGTLVRVIQEATLQSSDEHISTELRAMAHRLSGTRSSLGQSVEASARPSTVSAEDLLVLQEALENLYAEVRALRREVENGQEEELTDRLTSVEVHVKDALDLTQRLVEGGSPLAEPSAPMVAEAEPAWIEELEDSLDDTTAHDHDGFDEEWSDDSYSWRWNDDDWDAEEERRSRPGFVRHGITSSLFGTVPKRWPFPETALYNTPPAIRHNRVEGFVLGIAEEPLGLGSSRRAKLYGQVGRAFALERWRYEIGGELRLNRVARERSGLKVGAAYRYNTVTEDVWKANWVENTLAAFLFRNDFFDYYEAEGFSVYGVQRFSPFLQVSAGFRAEEHRDLRRTSHWSLFGGDVPRDNPLVDPGSVWSFNAAVEGGRVSSFDYLPQGAAFRLEAEGGTDRSDFGGDFSYSRLVGDGRVYLRVADRSSLALRLRGGYATGDAPIQKLFRLGGVGSVRGYPQNFLLGEQMVLANAELMIAGPQFFDQVFEDFMFFGFADAGYAEAGDEVALAASVEVFPSVGLGLALDERNLRFELAFPLKEMGPGFGREPSLWFRLSPTF